MAVKLFKEGDIVKVWSLQSFSGGGFLKGVEGIVTQDQLKGGSVIVAVERMIDEEVQIDPTYEVYPQQLKLVKTNSGDSAIKEFRLLIQKLKRRESEEEL